MEAAKILALVSIAWATHALVTIAAMLVTGLGFFASSFVAFAALMFALSLHYAETP